MPERPVFISILTMQYVLCVNSNFKIIIYLHINNIIMIIGQITQMFELIWR